MPLTWKEVAAKSPLCLNLGGGSNAHPRQHYEHLVSVDLDANSDEVWCVRHDLTKPFPLPDGCVDRIHTEDCLEHLPKECLVPLLNECHRLLKPGALMRIGVPDYGNPKDRFCLALGQDPRNHSHLTLTTYELMRDCIERSTFKHGRFAQFWEGDQFVQGKIDYSLGMIKRTPDNDRRCRRIGAWRVFWGGVGDVWFKVSRRFAYDEADFLSRKGHRLHVTSLVVDLTRT